MKKRIKLIVVLCLLIVILVGYSAFYFINVFSDKKEDNKGNGIIKEYNVSWHLVRKRIYYSSLDVVEISNDILEINFDRDIVTICEDDIEKCRTEIYSLNNDYIDIEISGNYEFYGGFKISYEDNMMILEKEHNNIRYVYYFTSLRG